MPLLDRLKEKPQHVKARYAFLGALSVTVLVGTFWAISLPARFGGIATDTNGDTQNTKEETERTSNEQQSLSELFGTTKDQVGSAIDSLERDISARQPETGTTTHSRGTSTPLHASSSVATTTETEHYNALGTTTESVETEPQVVLIATSSSEINEETHEK